jgi:low affinity Fe/Cu permease
MSKRAPDPFLRKLNGLYHLVSHPYSFFFIVLTVIGWFIFGFIFHFDESWYKWFHIYEIVIALLMVFLIENTTHADNTAMQQKLDEIIRALPDARNEKIGLEKHFKGEKTKRKKQILE